MKKVAKPKGKDIPIDKLIPLQERPINLKKHRGYRKIHSSIGAVGLIEPLCVFRENGKYSILDGFLRYKALQEHGHDTVPCLVYPDKEAYTYNRMVNALSPFQEMRMLRKALGTIDETTIAEAFGMKTIRHRMGISLSKLLHPRAAKALDSAQITRKCAQELTYVKPNRQAEIVEDMKRTGDYSLSFARALMLKTPGNQWHRKKKRAPWASDPGKKEQLATKLKKVQERHDFFIGLYRQYSTDLLKLCFYVRKLLANDTVADYLRAKHPEVVEGFEAVILEVGDTKSN